jgi:hypothetical protein
MIFRIYQKVSHPAASNVIEKESRIIGNDLRHAIGMIRCSRDMKRQLEKKHWARHQDVSGRTLYIEIQAEEVYTDGKSTPDDH